MSAPSPSRVRTKTSELADFFRGHHHSSRLTPRQPDTPAEDPLKHPSQPDLLDIPTPPPPSPPPGDSPTIPKRVSTRIPFLGRTRKKSTHSVKSGPGQSSTISRGYESEIGGNSRTTLSNKNNKDRRLSHPIPSPNPSSPHLPLPNTDTIPLPITVPQITSIPRPSTSSFSSKFVAHFKSRLAPTTNAATTTSLQNDPSSSQAGGGGTSEMLTPPVNPTRPASFDSSTSTNTILSSSSPTALPPPGSSSGPASNSHSRIPTGTINISTPVVAFSTRTPANLSDDYDFRDLFTLPRNKKIQKTASSASSSGTPASRKLSSTPASEYRDRYQKLDPSDTNNNSNNNNGNNNDNFNKGNYGDKALPPSPSTPTPDNYSAKKPGSGGGGGEGSVKWPSSSSSTPSGTPDSSEEFSRSVTAAASAGRQSESGGTTPPTIDVTPPPTAPHGRPPSQLRLITSTATATATAISPVKPSSPTPQSRSARLRATSSAMAKGASDPPTIPLPATPVIGGGGGGGGGGNDGQQSGEALLGGDGLAAASKRQRAVTLASTSPSPPSSPTIGTTVPTNLSKEHTIARTSPDLDLDLLNPKQLKQALLTRNQQYDDLAAHFLELSQKHAVERSGWEKRVQALEQELVRRERLIQGFTKALGQTQAQAILSSLPDEEGSNSTTPTPTSPHSPTSSLMMPDASSLAQRSPSTASTRLSWRRRVGAGHHNTQTAGEYYDSGAESQPTSGVDELSSSGPSLSISTKVKRGLRPLTLGAGGNGDSTLNRTYQRSSGPHANKVGGTTSSPTSPTARNGSAICNRQPVGSAPTEAAPPGQRTSSYSVSSSASTGAATTASVNTNNSSTSATSSSLLTPSPSIPLSSLSAIPESSLGTAAAASSSSSPATQQHRNRAQKAQSRVSTTSSSSHPRDSFSASASERETDGGGSGGYSSGGASGGARMTRRISTLSTSSLSSSSSSAGGAPSAYSAKLKRPPSIAQVLQQKVTSMDDVLHRLGLGSGSPASSYT